MAKHGLIRRPEPSATPSADAPLRTAYDPTLALDRLAPRAGADMMVVGQLGQSLDGRVATPTGKSKYISGREALAHLHRLRAAVDVVVVGVNTVIADDPALTVRHVEGRSPARAVVDPSGRLPRDARCLDGSDQARVLTIRRDGARGDPGAAPVHLEEIALEATAGRLCPVELCRALAARGLKRILIEGGPDTLSRAIAAGVVDHLHVMVSPMLIGSGAASVNLPPIDGLEDALRPHADVFLFGDGDVLVACDLRPDG